MFGIYTDFFENILMTDVFCIIVDISREASGLAAEILKFVATFPENRGKHSSEVLLGMNLELVLAKHMIREANTARLLQQIHPGLQGDDAARVRLDLSERERYLGVLAALPTTLDEFYETHSREGHAQGYRVTLADSVAVVEEARERLKTYLQS